MSYGVRKYDIVILQNYMFMILQFKGALLVLDPVLYQSLIACVWKDEDPIPVLFSFSAWSKWRKETNKAKKLVKVSAKGRGSLKEWDLTIKI